MNCRINLKRVMTCRILLEALMSPFSLFITLTYNDSNVRLNENGVPTLRPDDMINFKRRFARLGPEYCEKSLRWYGVGEYGKDEFIDPKLPMPDEDDPTKAHRYESENILSYGRPHFHMILFGCSAVSEPYIKKAWDAGEDVREHEGKRERGYVQTGLLTADRAAYAAQYTTKKMTKTGDDRLMGRYPEFQRSSRYGLLRAIGFPAVGWLADEMSKSAMQKQMARYGDVFHTVRIDGKVYPLGRYMRKELRNALGVPQTATDRAEHFGRVDKDTGEVVQAEPLPEYFGPWGDAMNRKFPLVLRNEQAQEKIDLYFAEKRAAKQTRQTRRTGTEAV